MATKILISGAGGFVGRSLAAKCSGDENFSVVLMSRETGDVGSNVSWERQQPVDVVVHLAAKTFVPDSWQDPVSFFLTNFNGTLNALEYCRKNKARMIFLSSYLYGKPRSLPINELADVHPINPYMASKRSAEQLCKFYAESFAVPVTILRPFNIYGKGQDSKFLIPMIIDQILKTDRVTVNDLYPKRDYVYLADLIEAIMAAIDKRHAFEIFNIASGSSHSVADVIALLQRIIGKKVEVVSREVQRQNEIADVRGDISKARHMLNWRPLRSLENGLREIIEEIER